MTLAFETGIIRKDPYEESKLATDLKAFDYPQHIHDNNFHGNHKQQLERWSSQWNTKLDGLS